MKLSILVVVGLITMGVIAQSELTTAQQSEQVPNTSQQQNDRRSPIAAKINPNKPIQIRVVNQSNVNILAVLAEPTSRERNVIPQKSVTFGTLHTSYLPPPIDLTVYTDVKDTNLRAQVKVVRNELIVTITGQPATFGITRSIYVDEKGSIYVY
ncbi:hypothetical protein [Calothrix sp. UHCC 0171]|uniref:hypothetical protein n=1 Tax=Calothrix sp. UHCC 0171 TaxID=3110245 RepID=UPI002B2014B1|nr:hypothetical protein [Calothrix sp. UHCC 0171]MEA5571942.1 hypothetical protein [Calothrix sp. UHCC 0171]